MYLQTLVQNEIKVSACRFNDINQKNELNNHPEINVTWNDFFVSFDKHKYYWVQVFVLLFYYYYYYFSFRFVMYAKLKLIIQEIIHIVLLKWDVFYMILVFIVMHVRLYKFLIWFFIIKYWYKLTIMFRNILPFLMWHLKKSISQKNLCFVGLFKAIDKINIIFCYRSCLNLNLNLSFTYI